MAEIREVSFAVNITLWADIPSPSPSMNDLTSVETMLMATTPDPLTPTPTPPAAIAAEPASTTALMVAFSVAV